MSVIATCKRFVRCARLVGNGRFHNVSGRVAVEEFRTYGALYLFGIIYHKLRTANAALACGYNYFAAPPLCLATNVMIVRQILNIKSSFFGDSGMC